MFEFLLELTGHQIEMIEVLDFMFFLKEELFPPILGVDGEVGNDHIADQARGTISPHIPEQPLGFRHIILPTGHGRDNIKIRQQINNQTSPGQERINNQPTVMDLRVAVVVGSVIHAIKSDGDEYDELALGFYGVDGAEVGYQAQEELVDQVEEDDGAGGH